MDITVIGGWSEPSPHNPFKKIAAIFGLCEVSLAGPSWRRKRGPPLPFFGLCEVSLSGPSWRRKRGPPLPFFGLCEVSLAGPSWRRKRGPPLRFFGLYEVSLAGPSWRRKRGPPLPWIMCMGPSPYGTEHNGSVPYKKSGWMAQ